MDEYQRSIMVQFFKPFPTLSPSSCHQFILEHIAPTTLPNNDLADVQPSLFQGSMSYTAILAARGHRIVVQFRSEQLDLFGVTEANRIHGNLVPLVTFRGEYKGLFVYTSCFVEGTPYIQVLMASPDLEMPLNKEMAALIDIADIVTRKAQENTAPTDFSNLLDGIKSKADTYPFRNTNLRSTISVCLNKLMPLLSGLTTLPLVLTHQDLSPFNYLINEFSGHIQAVLDWDGALYLPIGSNFHFVDSFFGYMTPSGWNNSEQRHEFEAAFYTRVLSNLTAQGFGGLKQEQLELQKAIGMLDYYMGRILKLRDEQTEHYLDGYLQLLTFMR
jgi:hypothetical protein